MFITLSADTFVEGDEEEIIKALKGVINRHWFQWLALFITCYKPTSLSFHPSRPSQRRRERLAGYPKAITLEDLQNLSSFFADTISKRILEENLEWILRMSFKWNWCGNQKLVRQTEGLSFVSRWNVKFDLKCSVAIMGLALRRLFNEIIYENFRMVTEEFYGDRKPYTHSGQSRCWP